LSAKTGYFDNRTGVDAVAAAMAQINKWGRFQIVHDKHKADLILLLSADPYHGGYIIFASGRTGTLMRAAKYKKTSFPITAGWLRCETPILL
jgi:hypothetical protein